MILRDYIRYLVDRNYFYDAAHTLQKVVEMFAVTGGKQPADFQQIIDDARQCGEYIRASHVINPRQMDELYAYVRHTLDGLCARLSQDGAVEELFLQSGFVMPIERFVAHGHFAVCTPVLTSDLRLVFFTFDCNRRSAEYELTCLHQYPDFFYLENDKVLAVRDGAQRVIAIAALLDCAQRHPSGAIDIGDCLSRKSLLTEEPLDVLVTLKKEKWY